MAAHDFKWETTTRQDKTCHFDKRWYDFNGFELYGLRTIVAKTTDWLTNDTCHEQQQYFSNNFFSKEEEKNYNNEINSMILHIQETI